VSWRLDSGHQGSDDLVADGEQRGDRACSELGHVVATGAAGFEDELLAAEFAQVVGTLAEAVVLGRLSGHRSTVRGELGDSEPCRGDREGKCCGERVNEPAGC
jgi:hypothetical protein